VSGRPLSVDEGGSDSSGIVSNQLSPDPCLSVWRNALKRAGVLVLCAAAVSCVLIVLHFEGLHPSGSPDFVGFYATGKIVRQAPQDLYQKGPQQRMEDQIFPHSALNTLAHLPYEVWIFEQLSYLPYHDAYVLWGAFNLGLLGLIFYLLRLTGTRLDDNSRLVWLLVCLPLAAGTVVQGQDSILLALLFLLSFLALKRRRDFASGLAIGACLFRFEIVIPFAFIFLLRRRWKFVSGFLVMLVTVLLASLAVVGGNGMRAYATFVLDLGHTSVSTLKAVSPTFTPLRHLEPTLRGFLAIFLRGVISPTALFLLVLAGTLFLLGWAALEFKNFANPDSPAFDLEFSLAVFAALLSSYYLYVHELTPLILVAFLTLGYESSARGDGSLKDRAGTVLWLLTALIPIVGSILMYRRFSVLFVVLLGLMVWLAQELTRLRNPSPAKLTNEMQTF
jgi:Glycosyltransferase family 87